MPAPTGKQWIRLYRGLNSVEPDSVDTSRIGSHWTSDPDVAYNFATNRDVWGWSHSDDSLSSGTVIEALVHRRHIIDPESEEGKEWTEFEGVLSPGGLEQEKTVRPRATVHLQRMHHVDDEANKERMVEFPRSVRSRGRA